MPYIRYGKRRYVPAECPACGDKLAAWDGDTFANLLSIHYGRWHVEFVKYDPVWKVPQWYGSCGKCLMREAFSETNSFLLRIPKDKTWEGGSYAIPFKPAK